MGRHAIRFILKHTVASAAVAIAIVGCTTIFYFALLLWAVVAGAGLGGPLAFPAMILFAVVASVGSILVLMPTTLVTEWISSRAQLHFVLQIPIAVAVLIVLVLAAALSRALASGTSIASGAWVALIASSLLLVPLGVYWSALRSTDWLLSAALVLADEFRRWRAGHAG